MVRVLCHVFLLQSSDPSIYLRPSVEEANVPAPAFARIFKEMILVTVPGKPLPRAGKGTIIRKQAMALYADEIDRL